MQLLKRGRPYRILKLPLYLLLCALTGCLLLLLSGLDTPSGMLQTRINYNIEQSVPLFVEEGLYPNLLSHKATLSTQADNWSETIILQSSMYMNTVQNPLSILSNPWRSDPDSTHEGILEGFQNAAKGEAANRSYHRYWQGFRVLIRPLLAVLDYSSIRELFRFIGLFLFCLTTIVLYRHAGIKFTLAFCSALFLVEYGVVTTIMQYSLSFYIALTAMILLPGALRKQRSLPVFFLIIGAATQFFDFYTVPCITLGLPLIFMIELKRRHKVPPRRILSLLSRSICAWFGSYAGMWLLRMLLVSVFLHVNAFASTFQSFFIWTGITMQEQYAKIGTFDAITQGFRTLFTKAHIALLVSGFMAYIVFLACAIRHRLIAKPNFLFLVVALIPLIWMIAASIPTTWHIFFQYRSLVVLLFACFAFAMSVLKQASPQIPAQPAPKNL